MYKIMKTYILVIVWCFCPQFPTATMDRPTSETTNSTNMQMLLSLTAIRGYWNMFRCQTAAGRSTMSASSVRVVASVA